MTSFFDLFLANSGCPQPHTDPDWANEEFRKLVTASPFRLWQPGDPIPDRGIWLLIGVATWSGYDMRLLDVIADAIDRQGAANTPQVALFNTADCEQEGDFRQYIPKLRQVSHTPAVGVWTDGKLNESAEGYKARDLAARQFGSNSAAIVAYVQDRIKARAGTEGG